MSLKTDSNGDDGDELWQTVTDLYRLTGNMWSLIIECFNHGMTNTAMLADRRRRRGSVMVTLFSSTVVQYPAGSGKLALRDR